MRNRIFALTLALMFIAAALGVALSVTLRNRANDGAEKAQALRAQAEDLETNGETGIWAIDAEKQKVYEKQDALTVEIKDLERQIKDDEDSIARDKQNIDELAGLYDQLDAAALRTDRIFRSREAGVQIEKEPRSLPLLAPQDLGTDGAADQF